MLVRIRNQGVVGSHHGNVEVNEVMDERRLVLAGVSRRQLLVHVGLDVPVRVSVTGVVVLGASNLDLPETPLGQVDVTGAQVTPKDLVFQTESGGQSPDSASVFGGNVSHNLYLPVVLIITNSEVTIRGDLLVSLGDRS